MRAAASSRLGRPGGAWPAARSRSNSEANAAVNRSMTPSQSVRSSGTSCQCSTVAHLVFAAQYEAPGMVSGWFDPDAIARNQRMMRNLVGPLLAAAPRLEHVSLLQGSKAYGIHHPELAARVRTPLRERDPRLEHP